MGWCSRRYAIVFQLYKGLMRTHCGRSCGYCKEEDGVETVGTDTSTGASVDSKCVDNHEKYGVGEGGYGELGLA